MRLYPIAPVQMAVDGALLIYTDAAKNHRGSDMLFGLSVLRHATEEQLRSAVSSLQSAQRLSPAEVEQMLVSQPA